MHAAPDFSFLCPKGSCFFTRIRYNDFYERPVRLSVGALLSLTE